jgi:murein tripeptide amidase MpaA
VLSLQEPTKSPAILIDGGHHARELSSIAMTVYTVLNLVHDYVREHAETLKVLRSTSIIVIPVVNVDGWQAIADAYHVTGFHKIRKNRRIVGE